MLEILNSINCLYVLDLFVSTYISCFDGSPSYPVLQQMCIMLAKFRVTCYSALWGSLITALLAVLSKPDKVVSILCEFCHQINELLHLSMTS